MKTLYAVHTQNRHNQVLIFTTKRKAIDWLIKVIRPTELGKNIQDIQEISVNHTGAYNIYPR